jgi:hypothetical protein
VSSAFLKDEVEWVGLGGKLKPAFVRTVWVAESIPFVAGTTREWKHLSSTSAYMLYGPSSIVSLVFRTMVVAYRTFLVVFHLQPGMRQVPCQKPPLVAARFVKDA